jgi:N,N-dimethylformamidase
MLLPLLGYSSALSVHAGGNVQIMVSSSVGAYSADVVRLLDGPRAGRAVPLEERVTGIRGEQLEGRPQGTALGSYVRVPLESGHRVADAFTIAAWVYPTQIPGSRPAGVFALHDAEAGRVVALGLTGAGDLALLLGESPGDHVVRTRVALRARQWYFVAVVHRRGQLELRQVPLSPWLAAERRQTVRRAAASASFDEILIGAVALRRSGGKVCGVEGPFNGKIAAPAVWSAGLDEDMLAALEAGVPPVAVCPRKLEGAWDFSLQPATSTVVDSGPGCRSGVLHGAPARAVTGPSWSGLTLDFRSAPTEYNAIHFHDDDLEDAGWDVALELQIPDRLASGVYAVRLADSDGFEDRVPFIVSPQTGRPAAPVLVLLPTLTYLAYANRHHRDEMLHAALRESGHGGELGEVERYIMQHPELGLSTYDAHSDGSQVHYASLLRPLVDLRPNYVNSLLGAPRHLSADLRLLKWLSEAHTRVDVVSDHDLHRYGHALLQPYDVLITGSHPEYCTGAMLDALEEFVHGGGRMMYLGGNGLYGVASLADERPHLLEIRRAVASAHFGQLEPGEAHSSLTGEPGGIWRHRGRPPQRLLGVGATAWGLGPASAYARTPPSFHPNVQWMFDGVSDGMEIGASGELGGAAGDELDRCDPALGSPPAAHVLATSRGSHGKGYEALPEERPQSGAPPPPNSNPLIRADLVLLEAVGGGRVFSVGSIAWVLALTVPDVSRVTHNVLLRFLSLESCGDTHPPQATSPDARGSVALRPTSTTTSEKRTLS